MDVSVGPGMVSTGLVTLVAGEVCTVTFADSPGMIEVISSGTADVWFTTDGAAPAPTVGGQMCWRLPAGGGAVDRRPIVNNARGDKVRMISSAATTVTVQRG